MSQAVMKALSKDPDQRFATAKEFYDAFSSGGAPSAAVVTPLLTPPPNYLLTPALNPSTGPVDQKGTTQIGEHAYAPVAGYAAMSGTGTAPGAYPTGGHYGTPAAGNVAFPVTAAIPPGPQPLEQKSGGGRGVLVALLSLLGLLSAAAVWIALTRHPFPSTNTGGGGSPTTTVGPVATHADLSATSVPVDTAPVLDTSIAPLNAASGTLPLANAKKADAGGSSVAPTSTLMPTAPTATTPLVTPTAPAYDPPSCVQARALRARNPQAYKQKVRLEQLKDQCVRAGGSL